MTARETPRRGRRQVRPLAQSQLDAPEFNRDAHELFRWAVAQYGSRTSSVLADLLAIASGISFIYIDPFIRCVLRVDRNSRPHTIAQNIGAMLIVSFWGL